MSGGVMSECPFCKTEVKDDAFVCRGCGAEKVNSFWGNFNRAFKEMHSSISALGFFALVISAPFGLVSWVNFNGVIAFVVFIFIFSFVISLPALLKTILFRRNKTIWYR